MLKSILPSTILLLAGINRLACGQCVGIKKSLFDSPYSHLTCTKEVGPDEPVQSDTTCVVRCKYLNRMSNHHCWSDGWSRDLNDDICVTSCSDPNEYYYNINWVVNCVQGCTKLPNGRYPNNVTAHGECIDGGGNSDTVHIKCDISGRWLVTNDVYCNCIDVEDKYAEYPCLQWNCTSSILDPSSPRSHDDHDSDNRFTKCKSTCPANGRTFKVTCDFDGEWRQARNKKFHCNCP